METADAFAGEIRLGFGHLGSLDILNSLHKVSGVFEEEGLSILDSGALSGILRILSGIIWASGTEGVDLDAYVCREYV